ncbi:hypothetical protein [Nocardia farcinica]|uniref:hypothetical protein n=1 Tax=Nocardia farcinica TaxID=37329 RepID=UPI002457E6A4|nr:hypothetical protein [Nocardia farcinica]
MAKKNVVRGWLTGVQYKKGIVGARGLEGPNELHIHLGDSTGDSTVVLEGSDAHELLERLQEILSARRSDGVL